MPVGESLAETLKQALQALHIRFLFPALLLVLVNLYLLFPDKVANPNAALLTIATVIVSSLLYGFHDLVLDIASGKKLQQTWLFILFHKLENTRFKTLNKQRVECTEKLKRIGSIDNEIFLHNDASAVKKTEELLKFCGAIREQYLSQLSELTLKRRWNFPSKEENILPTSLGNIIQAGKNYTESRYGIDADVLLSRIEPTLKSKDYIQFIERERIMLDLLLNISLICWLSCFELFAKFFYSGNKTYFFVCFFVVLPLAFTVYYSAMAVARDWIMAICTGFDLHREELRKALCLPKLTGCTLEEEKEQWESISAFIVYGDAPSFDGFRYEDQNT